MRFALFWLRRSVQSADWGRIPHSIIVAAIVALPLFFAYRCASAVVDYDPPERPQPTPAEVREQEENLRIVEETCADWWAGYIELPDHQAQVCVDGGYGK